MATQTFHNLPAAKRERVLNAAIEEFSQRSVEEAKISNIVRQAGIPRGSLYQYFATREDLYVYVFETLRERRQESAKPAFKHYKSSPFLTFFEDFYTRDAEFLIHHPKHIELGKVMYSHARGVSLGLIQGIQTRYRDIFLIAIEHDKEKGRIRPDVDSPVLTDLCVHFMTDVFIFQNISQRLSLNGVRKHLKGTLDIIRRGIATSASAG
ncbi:MAG: TetR/AcrR family transcriptional regulator [Propionibacteriaceae bacterium]|nr:TetR/AcrR family transcriptional regulator [Propionibacteriaceae bacterium]